MHYENNIALPSISAVDHYVIITKLLDSIFDIFPVRDMAVV
jgi:hypothetical protein